MVVCFIYIYSKEYLTNSRSLNDKYDISRKFSETYFTDAKTS